MLRVCAEAAAHGALGVEVSREAYRRFASDAPSTGAGAVIGESMVAYSVPLILDEGPHCTDYRPPPASGDGCGSPAAALPPPQPVAQRSKPAFIGDHGGGQRGNAVAGIFGLPQFL